MMTTIQHEEMAYEVEMYLKFGKRDEHWRRVDAIMTSENEKEGKWEDAYCYLMDHDLIED
jgi:hypothetical protein